MSDPKKDEIIEEVEKDTTLLAHFLDGLQTALEKLKDVLSSQQGISLARDASANHATQSVSPDQSQNVSDPVKNVAFAGLSLAAIATLLHIINCIEEKNYEGATKAAAGFLGGLQGAIMMGHQGAKLGASMGHASIAVPVLTIAAGLIGGFLGERAGKGLSKEAIEAFGHLKDHLKDWLKDSLDDAPLQVMDEYLTAQMVGSPELEELALEYAAAKEDAQKTFELGLSCGLDAGLLSKEFVRSMRESQQEAKRVIDEIKAKQTIEVPQQLPEETIDPNEDLRLAS